MAQAPIDRASATEACSIGLAIGDAWGRRRVHVARNLRQVTDFRAGGPHGLEAGEWTDDTSMALALADSIADGRLGPERSGRPIRRLVATGDYSVEAAVSTSASLRAAHGSCFRQSGTPDLGTTAARASGNGSIMRRPRTDRRVASFRRLGALAQGAESSSTDHASPQCLSAAPNGRRPVRADASFPAGGGALTPTGPYCGLREDLPAPHGDWRSRPGSFPQKNSSNIRGSGNVVRSLEAALRAFHDAADFPRGGLRAVNLGDDAYTTGPARGTGGRPSGASRADPGAHVAWIALAGRDWVRGARKRPWARLLWRALQ